MTKLKRKVLAFECQHANEVPRVCTCPKDCYCKTEGNCGKPRPKKEKPDKRFDDYLSNRPSNRKDEI